MQVRNRLFFDLDGTLLDSKLRVYNLFCHLTNSEKDIDFETYWNLKKKQIGHENILKTQYNYTNQQIETFQKEFLDNIEEFQWLQYDTPFEWVEEFLESLSNVYSIYIVTSRQSKRKTISQISQYKWIEYISDILVTEHKTEKKDLISSLTFFEKQNSWMIGDTGIDIKTGKEVGLKTAGVLSGFRDRDSLLKYNPDIIVEQALDLENFLKKKRYD